MLDKFHITNRNRKGTIAEAIAIAWLLAQEYDVYKNVSAWGKVDIIALKQGVAIFIDISVWGGGNDPKLANSKSDNYGLPIKYLYVKHDGTCYWRDDIMLMRTSNCPICDAEYTVKLKSSRNKCYKCSKLGKAIG